MRWSIATTVLVTVADIATAASQRQSQSQRQAGKSSSFIRKSDLPIQSDNWVSVGEDVEFLSGTESSDFKTSNGGDQQNQNRLLQDVIRQQQGAFFDEAASRQQQQRKMGSSAADSEFNSPYSAQPFANGQNSYDEYQQAWRFLGFFTDCDAADYDDIYNDEGNGSQDEDLTGEGCQRYLIWAAYVDLNYSGGGIGEYQFWDRDKQGWDTTSCNYDSGGSGRCAKMDCHEESTDWSLLGLFKHKGYDDWMEQLFKHEGFCVWSEDEYNFMDATRNAWPQGCASTGKSYQGADIYYDLKPTDGGGMEIGLYSDTACTKTYSNSDLGGVQDIMGYNMLAEGGSGSGDNNNGDAADYSLSESLAAWESAFSAWKICQPCVAYDLKNVGYNANDDGARGENYKTYTYGCDDDYNCNGNNNEADFDCYDQAGYTNVNQCMKFMAKTDMLSATLRDLSLAGLQHSLVENTDTHTVSVRYEGELDIFACLFRMHTT
mmetsp:Transcript_26289/g.47685  ORF Transcript_26289/g.47685 Transcript_26289/m.47685 type:complete len:489 (-) Transcript_26289:49-1515(-)